MEHIVNMHLKDYTSFISAIEIYKQHNSNELRQFILDHSIKINKCLIFPYSDIQYLRDYLNIYSSVLIPTCIIHFIKLMFNIDCRVDTDVNHLYSFYKVDLEEDRVKMFSYQNRDDIVIVKFNSKDDIRILVSKVRKDKQVIYLTMNEIFDYLINNIKLEPFMGFYQEYSNSVFSDVYDRLYEENHINMKRFKLIHNMSDEVLKVKLEDNTRLEEYREYNKNKTDILNGGMSDEYLQIFQKYLISNSF